MKAPVAVAAQPKVCLYFRQQEAQPSLSLSLCVCVCVRAFLHRALQRKGLPPACVRAAAKQSRSGMVVIGYESKFQGKSMKDRSDHCKSPKMPEKTLVHPLPGPCACPARFTSAQLPI